ncbi:hypothetical protein J6590_068972 [Homalodisca vitripennis]|nr:hypothetical protein J6590_068972 [Homalodisca vitripennis]
MSVLNGPTRHLTDRPRLRPARLSQRCLPRQPPRFDAYGLDATVYHGWIDSTLASPSIRVTYANVKLRGALQPPTCAPLCRQGMCGCQRTTIEVLETEARCLRAEADKSRDDASVGDGWATGKKGISPRSKGKERDQSMKRTTKLQ